MIIYLSPNISVAEAITIAEGANCHYEEDQEGNLMMVKNTEPTETIEISSKTGWEKESA